MILDSSDRISLGPSILLQSSECLVGERVESSG